jgi:Xaa-Pro aminopeptidase
MNLASALDRPAHGERLRKLRSELAARGLAGFIVPLTDEYHNEYLPASAQRLTWLTGFTGSAGLAIVLEKSAAIWSDGRYTLQLREQVDAALFAPKHMTDSPPAEWLAGTLKAGDKLGYDPWLHTVDEVERYKAACAKAGADLVALAQNPLDAAWPERPAPPLTPVVPHEARYAGADSTSKRAAIAAALTAEKIDAAVIALPESVAWLLNVRGGDVPHTPLPLSMAIIDRAGQVEWFIDRRKLSDATRRHVGAGVTLRQPDELNDAIAALGKAKRRVQVDRATAAAWISQNLAAVGANLHHAADPCLLPKACKNPVELAGARAAHRRDGAAVTRFLAWIAKHADDGGVDEIAAADKLESFRRENELFQDLSFPTISGAGPNGAIVHYRAGPASNRRLAAGQLYLIDSGGQYLDGTTDITRTVAIGKPTAEMRDRFTRVLKGHIAIATARFPRGTTGSQLDSLARRALWDAGLDYDHGTGHGVGSYLGVHEGPQRISKAGNTVALQPGMIVSNEPGYYQTGAYGIRIENLVAVLLADAGGEGWLGFETLTLAPIDRDLVDANLMTAAEVAWLDAYHARVREAISPQVDAETAAWLVAAAAPLAV